MNGPSVTDWIVAICSVVTAAATGVLAVGVVLAWRQAKDTLAAMHAANTAASDASDAAAEASAAQGRAAAAAEASSRAQETANEQAARDSIRRTRPYVFVELVTGLGGTQSADLRVANSGQSKASDLVVEIDQWPQELDTIAQSVRDMTDNRHTLPPGRSFRAIWSMWTRDGEFLEDPETKERSRTAGMPDSAVVTVRYLDDEGTAYADRYPLRIRGAGLTPIPNVGPRSGRSDPTARDMMHLGEAAVRYLGELSR